MSKLMAGLPGAGTILLAMAAALLIGCGSEPPPAAAPTPTEAPAPTATPMSAATPAPTAIPMPTTTPAPTASPMPTATPIPVAPPAPESAGGLDLEVTPGMVWRDVFDALTGPEQSCIRGELGDDLETALEMPFMGDDFVAQEREAQIFSCLAPDTARDIFVAGIARGIADDEGVELSEAQMSCLRDGVADTDVAAMIADLQENPSGADEFTPVLVSCLSDIFVSLMIAEMGVDPDELSNEQMSCLQEVLADADWDALTDESSDTSGLVMGNLINGLVSCAPDIFVSLIVAELGVDPDELSYEEMSCLQEVLADTDWATFFSDTGLFSALDELTAGLESCVPELSMFGQEPGSGMTADFVPEDAAPLVVGEGVEEELESEFDVHLFRFTAEAGQTYRIDVTHGTLEDAYVDLLDSDGWVLEFSDDSDDSLEPQSIVWEAPSAGEFYVEVGGYGAGSYTLTVAAVAP